MDNNYISSCTFCGEEPDDPDFYGAGQPNGFAAILPGAITGESAVYPFTDLRISMNGEVIDLNLTMEEVKDLRDLMNSAIESMSECADAWTDVLDCIPDENNTPPAPASET